MNRKPLSRFEALAQRLVEGSFKRLLGERLEIHDAATRLAQALEDSQQDGRAADLFTLRLHPDDLERLQKEHAGLAQGLADYLADLARQAGMKLSAPPQVTLAGDTAVRPHQMQIIVARSDPNEEQTTQVHVRPETEADVLAALAVRDAYLVISGRRHVALDRPLLTLGRRADNDVVLDSGAVSRQHAQIRWRHGRFVLYDLSRRGRTLVNDEPIAQQALQAGDVIALSETLLVYGEGRDDRPPGRDGDDDGLTLQLPKSDR